MGKRQQRAIASSLLVLVAHLLKWHFQPERRTRSWLVTIQRERSNIGQRTANRSAKAADALPEDVYRRAVRQAAKETGLGAAAFPSQCPYTAEQLRDHDFLPEP